MRTTVNQDDKLLRAAMRATGRKTKCAVFEAGLRLLVEVKTQSRIRRLHVRVDWQGDRDELRCGRGPEQNA